MCSLRTAPLCETSEMSVSLRWKLPDPLAWVSTAIGRQLEPGQGEAMVIFLFPFGKGEEGVQAVLLERNVESNGQRLSSTCAPGSHT